ncbi:hypothetical protein BJX61DRAFT_410325 [Aspergillus egyptiacus]|nr:hypothetical protein BJX61DRAFT_410325 [Aspergillus egyptiacus]
MRIMPFGSLPPEIVLIILESTDDITVLRDFCLVSKRFRPLAQRLLYREITLNPLDLSLSLFLLLRTFTCCPLLAAEVQYLDIDTDTGSAAVADQKSIADAGTRFGLSGADTGLLTQDAQELIHSIQPPISTGIWTDDASVLPALLLSRTPNLKHLVISMDQRSLAILVALATPVQRNGNSRHTTLLSCIDSLECLYLDCVQDSHGSEIQISDIALLLSLLQQLKELRISNCTGYNNNTQIISNPTYPLTTIDLLPNTLPLSTLSFRESHVDPADIATLVASCKELASFYCAVCEPIFLQIYYSLLSCQRRSLKDLRLSCESDSDSASGPVTPEPEPELEPAPKVPVHHGSLQEFTSMEFLSLDQALLGENPLLPTSLRHLAIRNCQRPILPTLAFLAALAMDGQLPELGMISLHTDISYPGGMLDLPRRGATDLLFDEACSGLRRCLLGTGILLRFDSNLLDKTVEGYDFAHRFGADGVVWPFIYLRG